MAKTIDPPWRFDPFQNAKAVSWGPKPESFYVVLSFRANCVALDDNIMRPHILTLDILQDDAKLAYHAKQRTYSIDMAGNEIPWLPSDDEEVFVIEAKPSKTPICSIEVSGADYTTPIARPPNNTYWGPRRCASIGGWGYRESRVALKSFWQCTSFTKFGNIGPEDEFIAMGYDTSDWEKIWIKEGRECGDGAVYVRRVLRSDYMAGAPRARTAFSWL